jgi:hypothetical protein
MYSIERREEVWLYGLFGRNIYCSRYFVYARFKVTRRGDR